MYTYRKMLVFLVSLAMIISGYGNIFTRHVNAEGEDGAITAGPPEIVTLYDSNFDSDDLGTIPRGWTSNIMGDKSEVKVTELNSNKALTLIRTDVDRDNSTPGAVYGFGESMDQGLMTLSFDVYRTENESSYAFLLGDSLSSENQPVSVICDYGNHYINYGSNWTALTTKNLGGVWYNYRFELNLQKRNYDLYINGNKMNPEPVSFNPGDIKQFAINHPWRNQGYMGQVYIDNVVIKTQKCKPEPLLPADLSEDVPVDVTFSWEEVDAESYTLIIDDTADFSSPDRIISEIVDNTYTLAEQQALDYNKQYFWKVVAQKGEAAWTADAVYSFTTLNDASGERNPSVFEAVPGQAAPGDMVQLIGDKFDQDQLMFYRIPDEDPATILGQSKSLSELEVTPDQSIQVIKRSITSISGVIPVDTEYGADVLWASNNTRLSNPVLINNAEVYFVSPDTLNTAKSREIRVIGKNLSYNNGNAVAHVYLKDNTGAFHEAELKKVSPYDLRFDMPPSLTEGSYEVWVHNGHGGRYGWAKPHTINIENVSHTNTYNINDYGAVPNDTEADTAAIQSAIDAAVEAGGGRVLVAEGQYIIDAGLQLKHDVELVGAGKNSDGSYKSIIKFIEGEAIGESQGGKGPEMINIETRCDIRDLRIVGSISVDRAIVIEGGATDVNIIGNYIDNYFPYEDTIKGYFSGVYASHPSGFKRIVVDSNTFEGFCAINIDGLEYGKISNNTIMVRKWTPVVLSPSSRNIIEGNTIDGRDVNGKRKASRGITFNGGLKTTGWKPTSMNYVANNLIQYVGEEEAPTNDGELVLFDCLADTNYAQSMHYGSVVSATGSTLIMEGVNWEADQMKGLYVLIVEGKGLGQYRKVVSNTANTLSLDSDWVINPDYTSRAVVTYFFVKNIVVDNEAENNKGNAYLAWGNCIGNIFDNNKGGTNGGNSIIAMDTDKPDHFFPAYYNVIKNFEGKYAEVGYREYGRGSTPRSVASLANVIQGSTVDNLDIYNSNLQQTIANMEANVFEKNDASSVITIARTAEASILKNNRIQGSEQRYADSGVNSLIIDYPVLQPPSKIYTESGDGYVKVYWDAVNEADGYYLLRSTAPDSGFSTLNNGEPVIGESFTDTSAEPGIVYYYKAAAWKSAYGQGDCTGAAYGISSHGINVSSTDYSSVQGERQWYYADGSGLLDYESEKWSNADQSVVIERHSTSIKSGSAIRQYAVPNDGKIHYSGYATKLTGADDVILLKVVLNNEVLKEQNFTSGGIVDGICYAKKGDILKFILESSTDSIKTYANEFAVDYTRQAPVPAVPQNNSKDIDLQPLFKWAEASAAQEYILSLSENADMSDPIFTQEGLKVNEYKYTGKLKENKTYYWKVTAKSQNETWEAENPVAVFTTGKANREIIFTDNFNLNATDSFPDGYLLKKSDSGAVTVKVAEIPGEYDKSLKITSTADNSNPIAAINLPEELTEGKYEISYRVMFEQSNDLHAAFFFRGLAVEELEWERDTMKNILVAYNDYWINWNRASGFNPKPGVWQDVKAVVNLDTKKYEVYVDNKKIRTGSGMEEFAFEDASIKSIGMSIVYDRFGGSVYYDDIRITEILPGQGTPIWPQGSILTATDIRQTTLTLNWTAASDGTEVTAYKLYRDGILMDTVTGDILTYTVSGLTANKAYLFEVEAIDASGNVSSNRLSLETKTKAIPASAHEEVQVIAKPVEIKDDGKISATPVLDSINKKATVSISEEDINKAFERVAPEADGIKVLSIEVKSIEGAKEYIQELPVKAFAGASADKRLQIATEFGTITVPSNMLAAEDAADAKTIALSIAIADKSKLGTELKALIGDRPVIELSLIINGKTKAWKNSSAPVTISIPYTPSNTEKANPEHIVVWYIDGSGNVVSVPNGKYDADTGMVTFVTTHFSMYAVSYVKKTFNDIGKYPWVVKAVEVLASKGILEGSGEAEFKPDQKITRGEFVMWLVNTLGLTAEFDSSFKDVVITDKYYEALGIARKLNIARGTGNDKFSPEKQLSRQDMMVLTIRALKAANKDLKVGTSDDIIKFADVKKVSNYALGDIATMVKSGLIVGSGKNLNPTADATRAEAAIMLYRIYNY